MKEWPIESACPGFKTTNKDFFDLCVPLHDRVLEVMAHGLNLEVRLDTGILPLSQKLYVCTSDVHTCRRFSKSYQQLSIARYQVRIKITTILSNYQKGVTVHVFITSMK